MSGNIQSCAAAAAASIVVETALTAVSTSSQSRNVVNFSSLLMRFLATYFAFNIYQLFIYPYFFSPLRNVPGPKNHHFLIGHAINQFRSGSPIEPFVSWMKQWPDEPFIRYMGAGNSESLLVTNLNAFKEILQVNTYSFVKPAFYIRMIEPIAGKGLVFSEGDVHKSDRKLLSGAFALSNIKRLIPVFQNKAIQLGTSFEKAIETEDGIIDCVISYSSLTLDIIGVAALGVDLHNIESATAFHEAYIKVFDPPLIGQLLIAINSFFPAIRYLPIEANRQFKNANDVVRTGLGAIVRQRIQDISAEEKTAGAGKDRIDLLTHIVRESNATETPWSEDKILDHIRTFLAAGHETTSSSLVWATHVLTKYPHIQERLRSEILGLVKEKPEPDYADIESLSYLNNFSRELLRVYCPAISSPREPLEDIQISGLHIPKGTAIMLIPAIMHLNPRIWGENVDEFDPDRWDHLTGEAASPNSLAAFFLGPRMCIGRVFSMLEFKAILIEIVSKFQFEAVEDEDKIELVNPSPLLRPKGGLKVRVRRFKA